MPHTFQQVLATELSDRNIPEPTGLISNDG
jgi:hypothetical protein